METLWELHSQMIMVWELKSNLCLIIYQSKRFRLSNTKSADTNIDVTLSGKSFSNISEISFTQTFFNTQAHFLTQQYR